MGAFGQKGPATLHGVERCAKHQHEAKRPGKRQEPKRTMRSNRSEEQSDRHRNRERAQVP